VASAAWPPSGGEVNRADDWCDGLGDIVGDCLEEDIDLLSGLCGRCEKLGVD
jgi:hypothetical protein